MKKILKTGVMVAMLVGALCATALLAACSNEAVTVNAVYSMQEYSRDTNPQMNTDWIVYDDYDLIVNSDNTYILIYSHAGCDYANQSPKGEQVTAYYGTYSSADGNEEGQLIYTLEKATRVIYYQHLQFGQYFGGQYYADTAFETWSDTLVTMTECGSGAEYLEVMAKSFTVTVDTLTALIVSIV